MEIAICATYDEMSRAAAYIIVAQVKTKPGSLLCFPSGESPAGVYKHLIADARAGKVDFSECYFVGLDEWVGMDGNDDGSCTQFLLENFFTPANIAVDRVMFFDAKSADLDAACRAMDDFIKDKGPVDVMMVGIGMNGHIGLNEPDTNFNLYAHHSPLADITINVGQKYFKQQTPLHEGITLGLKYLQEAKIPLLVASGIKKAEIIAQSLQGTVTEQIPASIFQKLPSARILLDEGAASQLTGV